MLELFGLGARCTVVDDNFQSRSEPGCLSGPVADHRRRRDDECWFIARGARQVSEHRRCLAEPHVERKASAKFGRVEKAEPPSGLRLDSYAARRRIPSGS